MNGRRIKILLTVLWPGLMFPAQSLWACAVCYGQSDSPMAQGMNAGIFTLLIVVAGVLAGVASFFVFLAKKSSTERDSCKE